MAFHNQVKKKRRSKFTWDGLEPGDTPTNNELWDRDTAQAKILDALREHGPCPAWRLRELLELYQPRVKSELDDLRKQGLVRLRGNGTRNWTYELISDRDEGGSTI